MATLEQRITAESGKTLVAPDDRAVWDAKSTTENPKGVWNAATNTPDAVATLTTIGDTLDVTVGGTNSVTGVPVVWAALDKIKKTTAGLVQIPNAAKPGPLSVGVAQLDAKVSTLVWQELPPESGYLVGLLDAKKRILFGFKLDGSFAVTKFGLGSIGGAALVDASIPLAKLGTDATSLFWQVMPPESGYNLAMVDAKKRIYFGTKTDGSFVATKYAVNSIGGTALVDGTITLAKLGADAKGYIWQDLPVETGYMGGFLDAKKRILWAVRLDGTFYAPKFEFTLGNNVVGMANLTTDVQNALLAGGSTNVNERVVVEDDNLLRGKVVDISTNSGIGGANFMRFPRFRTPVLQGINTSGQTLEFRKSSGLLTKAEKSIGTFTPAATLQELVYKGTTGSSPVSTGLVAGDYYAIRALVGTPVVINSQSYVGGDITIWDGTQFVKKAAPAPTETALIGHWWVVDTAGTFDKISYAVGDIIYCVAIASQGGPYTRYFTKLKAGEYACAGEFNPATLSGPITSDYVYYIASTAGSYDGKSFVRGDILVRQAGAWHKVGSEVITSIAAGSFFSFNCAAFADEYEVRRADVSATRVQVTAQGRSAYSQKASAGSLVAYTDSMGANLLSLAALVTPRVFALNAFGGGTSEQILSMQKYHILNGDPYKGWIHLWYHGQNNTSDLAQYKKAVEEGINMTGARDRRFLFLGVLGQRNALYNGTRLVIDAQEGRFQKSSTNAIYNIETYLDSVVSGSWISTYQVLLSSAVGRTTIDPTFPGMTEAAVASTYGVLPFSYWFDWTAAPFTAAQLNFLGYSDATPTGGSNFDYYLTTTGNLVVNVSGTWTTYTYDRIHTLSTVRTLYATAVQNWLTIQKF
ncbi:hypothetical protein GO755_33395 [Spirosoma sp. HMF4905]|uniref:Uncharacterized protein n=1 Tax=Spirosoma arboris TaxID=2682092 RepID=A0A7K1SME2_9BACT|nr:hypothetical protein [Spirosoma arboris]MVM34971.1 hypothetical protein [Spirosoma arboris]